MQINAHRNGNYFHGSALIELSSVALSSFPVVSCPSASPCREHRVRGLGVFGVYVVVSHKWFERSVCDQRDRPNPRLKIYNMPSHTHAPSF